MLQSVVTCAGKFVFYAGYLASGVSCLWFFVRIIQPETSLTKKKRFLRQSRQQYLHNVLLHLFFYCIWHHQDVIYESFRSKCYKHSLCFILIGSEMTRDWFGPKFMLCVAFVGSFQSKIFVCRWFDVASVEWTLSHVQTKHGTIFNHQIYQVEQNDGKLIVDWFSFANEFSSQ